MTQFDSIMDFPLYTTFQKFVFKERTRVFSDFGNVIRSEYTMQNSDLMTRNVRDIQQKFGELKWLKDCFICAHE